MTHVNNAMSIPQPKFPSVDLNVRITNGYSYFIQGPHKIELTYSMVMEPTHMAD